MMKISLLAFFMTSCSVSSPTANDIKQATNQLFKNFRATPVESISNLRCDKTSDDSSFKCLYTTTMADGNVLDSEGEFYYRKGQWERTH
ncbi:MAG: hypothetical protein JKX98_09385 [Alcanivoracaceae bacterium]|nr:hypothetical protein [Alcanivoracaceae bacterium]